MLQNHWQKKITDKKRKALSKTWSLGRGIKLPWEYQGTFKRYVTLNQMFLEPLPPFVTVSNDHSRSPLQPWHNKFEIQFDNIKDQSF